MSLWVETPTVSDKVTGEVLLAFENTNWSLDAADWVSDSVVQLWLRKYPGAHTPPGVMVTLDCGARTAQVGEMTVPLQDVERTLDRTLAWPQAPAPKPPSGLAGVLQRLFRVWRNDA